MVYHSQFQKLSPLCSFFTTTDITTRFPLTKICVCVNVYVCLCVFKLKIFRISNFLDKSSTSGTVYQDEFGLLNYTATVLVLRTKSTYKNTTGNIQHSNSIPGYIPQVNESMCPQKDLYNNMPRSFIHNSPKLGTT